MTDENPITADYVRQALVYCPETGEFCWRVRPREHFIKEHVWRRANTRYAGSRAGHVSAASGYMSIRLGGRALYAHRLAWLYAHGVWPVGQIDHINGVRADNRLANLRAVSPRENCLNAAVRSDNKSGVPGVYWAAGPEKWHARVWADGRSVCVGYFASLVDAVRARKDAEVRYGYHKNHGREPVR